MKFHKCLHTIVRSVRDPGLFLRSARDPGLFLRSARDPGFFLRGARDPGFFLRGARDPGFFLSPAKRPADENGEVVPEYDESQYQRTERNPGRENFIAWK